MTNVAAWWGRQVTHHGDLRVLTHGERTWTSRALYDDACLLAGALIARGIRAGDRVVLVLPSGRDAIVASAAVWLSGAVVVFVDPAAPPAELQRVAQHCEPALVIGPCPDEIKLRSLARIDDAIGSSPTLATPVERAPTDVALLVYSSGTTGLPKGTEFTHGGMSAYLSSLDGGPDFERVQLVMLPPTAFAAVPLRVFWVGRARLVVLERFDPRAVLDAVIEHGATELFLVPSTAEALLALADDRPTPSLRELRIGGAHTSPELAQALERRFGVRPVNVYGMTETGGTITFDERRTKAGTVGRAAPGVEVKIVGPDDRDVPLGQQGEIWARTAWRAGGYWRDPVQTESVFRPDGWIRTGDLGHLDADGDLFIIGRSKLIIIQGGYNVAPQEVEGVIRQIPGVRDCAVVGVADQFLGEMVVACVVRETGVTEQDVLVACRAQLDPRKLPGRVVFLEQLPRTPSGKVKIVELQRHVTSASAETALSRELRTAPPHQRVRTLIRLISDELTTVLGHAIEDPALVFGAMGVTSLGAAQVTTALGRALGRSVPITLMFRYPTIALLAEALASGDTAAAPVRRAARAQSGNVAIVGMACRLPTHAHTTAGFWEALLDGRDTVAAPGERWPRSEIAALAPRITARASYLAEAEQFDADFFALGSEAESIDPRHRMLLEVSWEALEDAGRDPRQGGPSVGVFFGLTASKYPSDQPLGVIPSMAAARLCQFLGIRGPTMTIDTTCSSSLVALHTAVRSLRAGECDVAIVGSASVIDTLGNFVANDEMDVLSPDTRCKPFDAGANGIGIGEGCVVMVLERMDDAQTAGARIYATIRGSAINHDGQSSNLAAPNPTAQAEVIRAALDDAGVDPSAVQYVEAHGTGTVIGDPIEVEGLTSVFGGPRRAPLAIGSVKSNLGHLEGAAGIASLLKVVLAFQHRQLPASRHFVQPNPLIPWRAIPIRVQSENGSWPSPDAPLIAGVSSFGMSGTNAHIVVEAPPPLAAPATNAGAFALPISARTAPALAAQIVRYADMLETTGHLPRDIAYSASLRPSLPHRLAVVGASVRDWAARLRQFAAGGTPNGVIADRVRATDRRVTFVFSGDGGQWWGMGRELAATEPVFRRALEQCAELIEREAKWRLLDELARDEATSRLKDAEIGHPALFAFQIAMCALWRSWGIEPAAVIGHSAGEVAAAHISGALTLAAAVRLIVRRAALIQQGYLLSKTGAGKMVSIGIGAEEAERVIADFPGVEIAASNGPRWATLSGDATVVDRVVAMLDARGVWWKDLEIRGAGHSAALDEQARQLVDALAGIEAGVPTIPMASTMTGGWAPPLEPAYWGTQMRQRVQFYEAARTLRDDGQTCFVEIGPHPVLLPLLEEICADVEGALVIGSTRRKPRRTERDTMLEALATLHCAGYEVSWPRHFDPRGRIVTLPSYAWEHARYWTKPTKRGHASRLAPLVQRHTLLPDQSDAHVLELDLDLDDPALAFVAANEIRGAIEVPRVALLELVWEALGVAEISIAELADVRFSRSITVADGDPRRIQVMVRRDGASASRFQIYSRLAGDAARPTLHAEGIARHGTARPISAPALADLQQRCSRALLVGELHDRFAIAGIDHGAALRIVTELRQNDRERLARVRPATSAAGDWYVHPAALEACAAVLGGASAPAHEVTGVSSFVALGRGRVAAWIHGETTGETSDVTWLDAQGAVVARAVGLTSSALAPLKDVAPRAATPRQRSTTSLFDRFRAATTDAEQLEIVREFLRRNIAQLVGSPVGDVEVTTPIVNLGIDSLAIQRLCNLGRRELGVEISKNLAKKTIEELAAEIVRTSRVVQADLLVVIPTGKTTSPATVTQKFFWQLAQLDPDPTSHIMELSVLMEGPLDRVLMKRVAEAVVARHSVFRSRLDMTDGVLLQTLGAGPVFELEEEEAKGAEVAAERDRVAQDLRAEGLDVGAGRTIRGRLLAFDANRHALVFIVHHAFADAQSGDMLLEEILRHYAAGGHSFERPPTQFIDYSEALHRFEQTPTAAARRDWWNAHLRTARPVDLPKDFPRPPELRELPHTMLPVMPGPISALARDNVVRAAAVEGVTTSSVYLSALAWLYVSLTHQSDICLETVYNARTEFEVGQGVTAAYTMLRIDATGCRTLRELLPRAQHTARDAYDHSLIPDYPRTVPLGLRRVLFNYIPFVAKNFPSPPGLKVSPLRRPFLHYRRHFELAMNILDVPEAPMSLWIAREGLFKPETIRRFADRYVEILERELAD